MTRLCVLGNSHLSALRMGWSKVAHQFPDVEIDFFGAAHDSLRSLRVVGRTLVTTEVSILEQFRITAKGKEQIDLDDYDGFVICLGLGLSFIVTGLANHRPFEMVGQSINHQLVSHAVLNATIKRAMLKGGAMVLARKIRSKTDAPILSCATPVPTRAVLSEEGTPWEDIESFRKIIEPKYARYARRIEQNIGMIVLPQPPETLKRGLTAERFSRGYMRLRDNPESGKTCDDNRHMNGTYGAIVIRQVMRTLRPKKAKPPARPEHALARWLGAMKAWNLTASTGKARSAVGALFRTRSPVSPRAATQLSDDLKSRS